MFHNRHYNLIIVNTFHYIQSLFYRQADCPLGLYDSTNPDWAPSLLLGRDKVTDAASARDITRHRRVLGRKRRKVAMETFTDAASGLVQLQDAAPEIVAAVPETGTATQTELDSATITTMQAEIQRLRSENLLLKFWSKKLSLKENDEKSNTMYTGLPYLSKLNFVYAICGTIL